MMIKKLLICSLVIFLFTSFISTSDEINDNEAEYEFDNGIIDALRNEISNRDIYNNTWYLECVILDNTGYYADFFLLSESPQGHDGPPADYHDAPQCPAPPFPYVLGYSDDNLGYPYDKLLSDCRHYPDTYKIFNVTVVHDFIGVNTSNYGLEFSWTINGSDDIEYSNIEFINTLTNEHFSFFEQSSWSTPVEITGSTNYKIICDLVHLELGQNWNFISPYCIITSEKSESLVCYHNTTVNWSEAVNSSIIVDSVFTWDNLNQSYIFSNSFHSGKGYWVYAHEPCYLWLKNYTILTGDRITNLQEDWNMIGSPFDTVISKNNVTIELNDTKYSWSEAVNNGFITDVIYLWNATTQSYEISNSFAPGKAYWLYAYQPCEFKRS